MTNKEKEQTRCLIGKAINIPPDDITMLFSTEDKVVLYVLDDYMGGGNNLVIGFNFVPTLSEAREDVKNLYLAGVEWDWEENNPI